REHERLGHAHDRELVVGVAGLADAAVGTDDADAEQRAVHRGERRVDGRVFALGVGPIALVRIVDELSYPVTRGQVSGRYELDLFAGCHHVVVTPSSRSRPTWLP